MACVSTEHAAANLAGLESIAVPKLVPMTVQPMDIAPRPVNATASLAIPGLLAKIESAPMIAVVMVFAMQALLANVTLDTPVSTALFERATKTVVDADIVTTAPATVSQGSKEPTVIWLLARMIVLIMVTASMASASVSQVGKEQIVR